ncbi:MAG TPA: caspase family protein, partial [bacterium]|nr:caspase family protein [bacterium]
MKNIIMILLYAFLGTYICAQNQSTFSPFQELSEPPVLTFESGLHLDRVNAVRYSPDGKEIVTASWDKTIRIWDAWTGQLLRSLRVPGYAGTEGQIFTMDISPDKKYILIAGSSVGQRYNTLTANYIGDYVLMLDYVSGAVVDVAAHHKQSIYGVRFSPDGKKVVSVGGSFDNRINQYDVNTNTGHLVLRDSAVTTQEAVKAGLCNWGFLGICDHQVVGTGFVDNGNAWLAADYHGLVFRKKAGENLRVIGKAVDGPCRSIATDAKGKLAAIGDFRGRVRIIDALQNEGDNIVANIMTFKSDMITAMVFDTAGEQLAVCVGNEVRVYSLTSEADGRLSKKHVISFRQHDRPVFAVAFSPDGKHVVSAGGLHNEIHVWNVADGERIMTLGDVSKSGKISAIGIHRDHPNVIGIGETFNFYEKLNDYGTISKTFNLSTFEFKTDSVEQSLFENARLAQLRAPVSLPDIKWLLDDRPLCAMKLQNGKLLLGTYYGIFIDSPANMLSYDGARTIGLAESPDGRRFYVGLESGEIKIYDENKMTYIASLYVTSDNEWIIWTTDGYYAASKRGAQRVGWQINKGLNMTPKFYPFEQFDLRLNRPDIVLQRLGVADSARIAALYGAYQRRLKRLGLTESQLGSSLQVPDIQIKGDVTETDLREVILTISAYSKEAPLERLMVNVNDVPLHSSYGKKIGDGYLNQWNETQRIPLTQGRNKIQVSVINTAGIESLKETRYVHCRSQDTDPALYVIAVGVSHYTDREFDLQFAAKDAGDITDFFRNALASNKLPYSKLHIKTLLNEQATKDSIIQVRNFIANCKPQDGVVMYFAGHGIPDSTVDWVFATYDIDFYKASEKGITFAEMEGLLDGIAARKKLMLVDACHSGERDRDETEIVDNAKDTKAQQVRAFKNVKTKSKSGVGLVNSFELMQHLFSDLQRGSGAVVISAASGTEWAAEGDIGGKTIKNGVFTYGLLEGLRTMAADRDKNGKITVTELRDYVM